MSRRKTKKKQEAATSAKEDRKSFEGDFIVTWADNFIFSLTLLILFFRPFISGRTYPDYNHFFHLGVGLLTLLWLVKCWRSGTLHLHNRLLTGFVCAFLLICSLTFFTSVNRGFTLRYIYELTAYTLLFLVIANNFRDAFSIKGVVITMLAAAVAVTVYGLYQRYYTLELTRRHIENAIASQNQELFMGIPLGQGILERLGSTRVFSSFLFPNAYAMYLVFVGAIAIGWIWSMRGDMRRFAADSRDKLYKRVPADTEAPVYGMICGGFLIGALAAAGVGYYIVGTEVNIVILAMVIAGGMGAGIGFLAARSTVLRACVSVIWYRLKGFGGLLSILIFGILCILIPWNLWMTYSRGGWLSALFALLVFVVVWIWNRKAPSAKAAAIIFLAVLSASFLMADDADSAEGIQVHEESLTQRLQDSLTVVRRFSYLKTGFEMVKDRPWFGVGWGAFEKAYPRYMILGGHPTKLAHNNFLQVWAETGILGLNAFVGIWLVFVYTFWRKVRPQSAAGLRGIACGLGAGVFGFIAHSMVDFDLYLPTLSYHVFAMMGLLVAVPTQESEEDRFSIPLPKVACAAFIFCVCLYSVLVFRSYMGLSISSYVESERNTAFPTKFALQKGIRPDPEKQRLVLERSIPLLRKAIAYYPLDADAYHMLGDTYLRLAQTQNAPFLLDEAIEQFERAAELNPFSPHVFQSLATAYWLAGNKLGRPEMFHNALRAEKKASANFPVNPEYHRKLSQIYRALGMKEQARDEALKTKELRKHYKEN
jgi:O-antigen ligase/cytochrome c-type biogenesis protein CcmH/NrfG